MEIFSCPFRFYRVINHSPLKREIIAEKTDTPQEFFSSLFGTGVAELKGRGVNNVEISQEVCSMKYAYKRFALGGILAGSLIAAPALAHGPQYSSKGEDTSQSLSYSSNGDTYSSSDTFSSDGSSSFSSNEENPPASNDSSPDSIGMSQLQRDRDKLERDLNSGAGDDQIAQDRRAIEMDQQGSQDSVAFSGDGSVTMGPSS